MAFVANSRIYLRSLSALDAKPIPGTEGFQNVTSPTFSPDGQMLAFYAQSEQALKRIATSGGAAVTICSAANPWGMSWDQDSLVFGQGRGGIMRVPAASGKPELIVAAKEGEWMHGPQLLPGGKHVMFTLATGTSPDRWDKAQIVVQTMATGERKTVVETGTDGRYLPTGHLVYALGGSVYAVEFDADRLADKKWPHTGDRRRPARGGRRHRRGAFRDIRDGHAGLLSWTGLRRSGLGARGHRGRPEGIG